MIIEGNIQTVSCMNEVAVQCAFLMEGWTDCIYKLQRETGGKHIIPHSEDKGHIERVQQIFLPVAKHISAILRVASQYQWFDGSRGGVFEYEVTSLLGFWMAEMERTPEEVMSAVKRCAREFFVSVPDSEFEGWYKNYVMANFNLEGEW
jgi:hypothetical protein